MLHGLKLAYKWTEFVPTGRRHAYLGGGTSSSLETLSIAAVPVHMLMSPKTSTGVSENAKTGFPVTVSVIGSPCIVPSSQHRFTRSAITAHLDDLGVVLFERSGQCTQALSVFH